MALLNGLSAIMVPICCDSLKGFGANWKYGVGTIPVIDVAYAENRKTAAGVEFTRSQFRKIQTHLEEIAGRTISDEEITAAVKVYNENRAALREFSSAAARHPEAVSPAARCARAQVAEFFLATTDIPWEHLGSTAACLTSRLRSGNPM